MTNTQLIKTFESKYEELSATIQAAQDKIKAESQAIVSELFKDFFTNHGKDVYSIHWTQYTPYFNDGESCEFSVYDVYLSFTEEGYEDGEGDADIFRNEETYREHLAKIEAYETDPRAAYDKYVTDFNERYKSYSHYKPDTYERYSPSYYEKDELLEKIALIETRQDLLKVVEDFEVLKKVIDKIDDRFMEMIYGNHVKVTYFGPDGTLSTDSYEHD